MSHFHSLAVKKVVKETPNAVSIEFIIPENLKETFTFLAGQYITIKHTLNGAEIRRAYSICSAPKKELLKVGVKKVEGGSFSVFANTELKEGDVLEVMPPQGKFVLNPDSNHKKKYVSFAAGSGITPVISILTTVLEEEPQSTFLLVYGNKSVSETMFYNELKDLKEKYPDRFSLEYVFSQTDEDGALFGRISKSNANYFLKNKYKGESFDTFYLCGPETMINEVTDTLKENGVHDNQINFELFTTSESEAPVNVASGMTKITVIVDDESISFDMSQKKLVLDAVLEQKIDAPYSCQGGVCSTCIAKVVEGKVTMVKNQILTDSELEEGLVLTCQSHAITPTLVIDYDDV
ncbi:MAG: ring-1,2-phenylacetyl-CoA epoxidase subunit PaaE [Flavobacteriaceae bacterium]|jgi:ring-1,2-phenylacetyl-CoA epoxidase subunit PaaE